MYCTALTENQTKQRWLTIIWPKRTVPPSNLFAAHPLIPLNVYKYLYIRVWSDIAKKDFCWGKTHKSSRFTAFLKKYNIVELVSPDHNWLIWHPPRTRRCGGNGVFLWRKKNRIFLTPKSGLGRHFLDMTWNYFFLELLKPNKSCY